MRVPNRHIPNFKAECSQPCGNLKDCGSGGQSADDEKCGCQHDLIVDEGIRASSTNKSN
jgi:hypothetical protein